MSNSLMGFAGTCANLAAEDQGLFQVSVKLPHEPYKIQVMVGVDP